jgi:hypothetical protein
MDKEANSLCIGNQTEPKVRGFSGTKNLLVFAETRPKDVPIGSSMERPFRMESLMNVEETLSVTGESKTTQVPAGKAVGKYYPVVYVYQSEASSAFSALLDLVQ